LGAFSQAQKKGSEALQKMLQDGLDLQRQAQQTAEQKIADASSKMSAMAQQLAQGKTPLTKAATNPWDSLEGLFEQRVLHALTRMGWPTPQEFQALNDRVAELEQQLQAAPRTTAAKKRRPPASKRNG
jgi:poly(hydroxyalkanoate) granule-associated protein